MGSSPSVFLRGREEAVLTSRSSLLGSLGNSATGAPSAPKSGPPQLSGNCHLPWLSPCRAGGGGHDGRSLAATPVLGVNRVTRS